MTNSELCAFYKNFYDLVESGIPITGIFETLRSTAKGDVLKKKYSYALSLVNNGQSLTDSLKAAKLISPFDVEIIRAAETSGKLTIVLKALAQRYETKLLAEKEIRSALWRPLFLILIMALSPGLPDLISGKTTLIAYCFKSFGQLGIFLGVVYSIFHFNNMANQNNQIAQLRHNIFTKIPFVSGLMKKMALEDFCSSLAFMLEAGIDMLSALAWAGSSSADLNIAKATQLIQMKTRDGKDLAESFRAQAVFTDDIKNAIHVGHQSGKIPTMLYRVAKQLNGEIVSRIQTITKVVPFIILIIMAYFVGKNMISFQEDRLKEINKLMDP